MSNKTEIKEQLTVKEALELLNEGYSDEWPEAIRKRVDAAIKSHVPDTNVGEITGDNLREWAIGESKNLAQRDKDFFFLGVGQLWESVGPQIAALTHQRDTAREDLQKMIDQIPAAQDQNDLILKVLRWAAFNRVHPEAGYWAMDYSSIAYTNQTVVEEFLKTLTQQNKKSE